MLCLYCAEQCSSTLRKEAHRAQPGESRCRSVSSFFKLTQLEPGEDAAWLPCKALILRPCASCKPSRRSSRLYRTLSGAPWLPCRPCRPEISACGSLRRQHARQQDGKPCCHVRHAGILARAEGALAKPALPWSSATFD